MPARCRTCSHPDRDSINREILHGEPDTQVAARYGLNRESVRQHRIRHLQVSTEHAQDRANALTVVGFASDLYNRACKILDAAEGMLDAEGTKGVQAAAASLREVRQSIELLSRLITTEPEAAGSTDADLDALIMAQVVQIQTPLALPASIDDAEVVDSE